MFFVGVTSAAPSGPLPPCRPQPSASPLPPYPPPLARKFGEHTTAGEVMARQVRIERQDKALFDAISFDKGAANKFQEYVQGGWVGVRLVD